MPWTALITACICLITALAPASAARASDSSRDLLSFNISHPLIFSVASGTLYNNLVTDAEVGLGGGKIGVGLGAIEDNSFIAVKAIAMYKWEEPFGKQYNMKKFIDQIPFPNHKWYYGAEAVLSNQGVRLSLAAYKIYRPEEDDSTDIFYGASIGLGF